MSWALVDGQVVAIIPQLSGRGRQLSAEKPQINNKENNLGAGRSWWLGPSAFPRAAGRARSTLGSVVLPSLLTSSSGGTEISAFHPVPPVAPRLGVPWSTRAAGPGDGERARRVALVGACVHGASQAEKGAHRAPTPGRPCLLPCPSAEGPWGCLHATSVGAEGMEQLRLWDGCFACSPLPCMSECPCSPASYRRKYRPREPGEDALWRMHPCRNHAEWWHGTGFLLEPRMDTQTTVRARPNASPALSITAVGCACLAAELSGMINRCLSPQPSPC